MLLPNKSAGRAELGLEGLEGGRGGRSEGGRNTPQPRWLPALPYLPSIHGCYSAGPSLPPRPALDSFFLLSYMFFSRSLELSRLGLFPNNSAPLNSRARYSGPCFPLQEMPFCLYLTGSAVATGDCS